MQDKMEKSMRSLVSKVMRRCPNPSETICVSLPCPLCHCVVTTVTKSARFILLDTSSPLPQEDDLPMLHNYGPSSPVSLSFVVGLKA